MKRTRHGGKRRRSGMLNGKSCMPASTASCAPVGCLRWYTTHDGMPVHASMDESASDSLCIHVYQCCPYE